MCLLLFSLISATPHLGTSFPLFIDIRTIHILALFRVQKVRNLKNVRVVDENHLGEDGEERSSANTFSAAIVIHLLVCLAQYLSCVYSY